MAEDRLTRREIIKKAAYLAPLILTLPANFSFASAGSGNYKTDTDTGGFLGRGDEEDVKQRKHKKDKKDKKEKKEHTSHDRRKD